MGDAARHLPERPQPFLLHHGVLTQPQIVVRLLQSAVEPRLMACQGDVLAELSQEFALAAAEGLLFGPRAHQHSEYLVLHDQRRDHQGAQPGRSEPLRKRKGYLQDIGLVDQLPRDAARQSVGVERHIGLVRQTELVGVAAAGRADRADGQRLRDGIVQQKAAEIDGQILLETAENDLKDARQVLAFARGARDVLQQAQAAELGVQFALGLLYLRQHLIECVGKQVEFIGAGPNRAHGVVMPLRYRPGRVRERENRMQQLVLQPPRYQIAQRQGNTYHQEDDQRIKPGARIHRAEVRFDEQRAEPPRALDDRLKAAELGAAERVAHRARAGRKMRRIEPPGIFCEQRALSIVERRGDDMRLGLEGCQNAGGIVGIVERQGSGAVAGDRRAQCLQLLHAGLPEGQELVGAKRRGGHGKHRAAGEKYHPHQDSADRRG